MPEFMVEATKSEDGASLHVRARRADGDIRELDVPLMLLKRFNIAQRWIDYITGETSDAKR
jgi:hypothetical protein